MNPPEYAMPLVVGFTGVHEYPKAQATHNDQCQHHSQQTAQEGKQHPGPEEQRVIEIVQPVTCYPEDETDDCAGNQRSHGRGESLRVNTDLVEMEQPDCDG
jgi:hypothetical protein